MHKFLIFTVLLGLVVADHRPKRTFSTGNEIVVSEYPGYELISQHPYVSAITDLIRPLIGYKASALSIAVSCIEWVASNVVVIAVGAISALGFCKITGKCTLNYEQYLPVEQIQGIIATPENLETAQQFLVTAVQKYAEKRKRSL